jgi:hypothetical protein
MYPQRLLSQGKFEYVPLKSVWEVQRHIRRHGAVLTRFDIYQAFRDFYKAGGNARKVYIHRNTSSSRSGVEGHAVVLVGYNLTEGTWKVRNSWGVAWGDQGYFRVSGVHQQGGPVQGEAGVTSDRALLSGERHSCVWCQQGSLHGGTMGRESFLLLHHSTPGEWQWLCGYSHSCALPLPMFSTPPCP